MTGPAGRPPFGKGSLGIAVADSSTTLTPPSEKVDFGNEVDFFGDPVLDLDEVGFHVFQTDENVGYGGLTNMPNIKFEMDPNVPADANNYTTLVWLPGPAPVTNRWSGYIDATSNGLWFFTGDFPTCSNATPCSFDTAMTLLGDGTPDPIFYSVAVAKGRDSMWIGAVDGLRLNNNVYDFEETGVKVRNVGRGGGGGDDD